MAHNTRHAERNREVSNGLSDKLIRDKDKPQGNAFSWNAKAVNVNLDKLPPHKQEDAFHILFNKGYRLNRFGTFHSGDDFAEFIPQE